MASECLPRVGSALVVREGDKILLARRNKSPNRGRWVIPGGKVEPFESISAAGEREILEETGLVVRVGEQIGVFEIISPPNEHRLIIYSWADRVGGDLRAGSDALEPQFFYRSGIQSLDITEIVKTVLRKIDWLD